MDGTGGGTGSTSVVVVVDGTGGGTGSGTGAVVVVVDGTGGGTGNVVLVVATDDDMGGGWGFVAMVVVPVGGSVVAPEEDGEPDGISEPPGESNHGDTEADAGDVPDDSGVTGSAVPSSGDASPPPEESLIGSPVSPATTAESPDESTDTPPCGSPLRERANRAPAPTSTTTMTTTNTERLVIPAPRASLGSTAKLLALSRVVLGNAPQHHHSR